MFENVFRQISPSFKQMFNVTIIMFENVFRQISPSFKQMFNDQ